MPIGSSRKVREDGWVLWNRSPAPCIELTHSQNSAYVAGTVLLRLLGQNSSAGRPIRAGLGQVIREAWEYRSWKAG